MLESVLRKKLSLRIKRKKRIRGNIDRGVEKRPRVSIFKSNRTLYVQAIEDINNTTLAHSDGKKLNLKANKEGAAKLAEDFSQKLKEKGISEAVFDRNGYLYHGVIATFAETLRKNGIKL